ncbi:hypothetical protein [Cerasicoccus arenae]|uniref:hypothetical protein n=1 Tax=Cerasicoccus arenae TaxID=424488 RepID=UPI001674AE02|nr:hypothetical protein [Cerasicoccus arenae]MBK1857696.1 hypothetical protein [Cerasicoccus arenae]
MLLAELTPTIFADLGSYDFYENAVLLRKKVSGGVVSRWVGYDGFGRKIDSFSSTKKAQRMMALSFCCFTGG